MQTHAANVATLPPPLPPRCHCYRRRHATTLPTSTALLPLPACCHRQHRAALNDTVAFVFIVFVIAFIIAVSVTVATADFI